MHEEFALSINCYFIYNPKWYMQYNNWLPIVKLKNTINLFFIEPREIEAEHKYAVNVMASGENCF